MELKVISRNAKLPVPAIGECFEHRNTIYIRMGPDEVIQVAPKPTRVITGFIFDPDLEYGDVKKMEVEVERY